MARFALLRLLLAAVGPAAVAVTAAERGHRPVMLAGRWMDGGGWTPTYPTSGAPRPLSARQEDFTGPLHPADLVAPGGANVLVSYARCSTDKQDLAAQRHTLRQLGVSDDRVYLDHGMTGRNRRRPGLQQALAAVRQGDTLVVPKGDVRRIRGRPAADADPRRDGHRPRQRQAQRQAAQAQCPPARPRPQAGSGWRPHDRRCW